MSVACCILVCHFVALYLATPAGYTIFLSVKYAELVDRRLHNTFRCREKGRVYTVVATFLHNPVFGKSTLLRRERRLFHLPLVRQESLSAPAEGHRKFAPSDAEHTVENGTIQ